MKTFITAFLLLILHFNCTAQWIELNVGNTTASNFTDVYAITPDVVVVVGNNGTILKTTDGGETWQQKSSGTNLSLGKIQFPTTNIGYVTAGGNSILKTIDSGETWIQITIENISMIDAMSCANENLVFLNTDKGLTKSEDGGVTWSVPVQSPFFGQHGTEMQFFNKNSGFIGIDEMSYIDGEGWANRLSKTTDTGISWQNFNAMAPFHFLNENLGFYYFSGLYKTINGGSQFEQVSNETAHGLRKIIAINENTIWGILDARALNWDTSSQGIIKLTKNETGEYIAKVWNDNSFDIDMTSMHFANENSGYIIGRVYGKNTLWKNTTGSNTTLDTTESDKINVVKIFPNPTSDKINIQIDNQFPEKFSINLTDMSGKLVYTQNYNSQQKISIDVQGFAKGTYILTIKNLQKNYSQKLIIR